MNEEKGNDELIHDLNNTCNEQELEVLFEEKLREARKDKVERQRKLREFLSDPEVQAYYSNPDNIL